MSFPFNAQHGLIVVEAELEGPQRRTKGMNLQLRYGRLLVGEIRGHSGQTTPGTASFARPPAGVTIRR
jgi:hypothetical protein